jgi:hypothetical protein
LFVLLIDKHNGVFKIQKKSMFLPATAENMTAGALEGTATESGTEKITIATVTKFLV